MRAQATLKTLGQNGQHGENDETNWNHELVGQVDRLGSFSASFVVHVHSIVDLSSEFLVTLSRDLAD